MSVGHFVRTRFEAPGMRWVASALATARQTATHRDIVVVHRADAGAWTHHFPDGVVVSPRLSAHSPGQLRRGTHDAFLFGYVPRPGDIVLDVGAGSGTELVTFSELVGREGRVIALEPHPVTFRRLELTAELNTVQNALVLPLAVGAASGVLRLGDTDDPDTNQLTSQGTIEVEVTTLDDLARAYSLRDIGLLKMNIEGGEMAALHGATRSIGRIRNVAISCHDFLADRGYGEHLRTSVAVRSWLEDRGFTLLPRRAHAPAPWLCDYVYGRRAA